MGAVYFLFVRGDEGSAGLFAGGEQEGIEGGAGGHFVDDVLMGEVVGSFNLLWERGEVGFDELGFGRGVHAALGGIEEAQGVAG